MPRRGDQSPNLASKKVPESPNMATKVPPVYSPRIDGGAVLATRLIPPSPLSKDLDGPAGPASSTSVDYDDVFGGPPRLATTMFGAEDSHGPSAALDRSAARAPSFRSRALPVFELPVFGDEAFGGSNTFEQGPISVAYDDIFREEVHVPDIYPKYGNIPRSRASSRSASRRMSPVHPAVPLAHQLLQEELYAAAKTGAFSKDWEGRNSFSSSSFDEVRGNPGDPVSMVVRNDTVGSSLPASPRQSGMWGHVKRFTASKSVHNLGSASTNVEVDDVFGGFPQRTCSPVFQAANQETSKSSRIPRAYLNCTSENSAPGSPLIVNRSKPYEGLGRALSRSSSSDSEKEVQDDFAKIGMDKRSDAAPEKMEAAADRTWVTVNDLRQSTHSIPRKVSARLPPVPFPSPPLDGKLKHRSWKDWASNKSERPPVFSSSSGLAQDTSMAFGNAPVVKKELNNGTSTCQPDKGVLEARSLKQVEKNTVVQPRRGKFTLFSPLRTASKAKPVVEPMQLEEVEVHTGLKNSGKTNEKWGKIQSSAARTSEGPSDVIDPTTQDFNVEGKKLPSRSPKTLSNQHGPQSIEHKLAEPRWKAWKKHPSKEKVNMKESTKVGLAQESKQMKAPDHSVQNIIEKRSENSSKSNLSECDDFFDPEKIVEVVTEETSANGPRKETDRWYHTGLHAKSSMKVAEDVEIAEKRNPSNHLKDGSKASSAHNSRNGSFQDFGQNSEQQEVIFSKGIEEVESQVIGLDASLVGFQEIEGESVECRKARWVCHLQAEERAARALEEMQKRDAEVLRQQAEKQQWAENGDRQIKRWATGKEGNLRALLSNMQQVLWADSGWKPISLTDLIEGSDVKKAYRKATLFVHPDKLQQKGATLQQKYIAERVFDILQEAWKTFNLQELF